MINEKYIASLDIGTTTIRCFIYDSKVQIKGFSSDQVTLLFPEPGRVEIDPEYLWSCCINTVNNAIKDAKLIPEDISCIGLSTQRASFVTWDKETGEIFHNFITWKDLRADELVQQWNNSFTMKAMRTAGSCLYLITRNKRFLAASVLKLMNNQVTLRLAWVINNNDKLKKAIEKKTALFGTVDCWLLYRLRQGNDRTKQVEHITDITNATATGFYDPFCLAWGGWALNLFSISADILPKVVNNNYNFGFIDKSIFGCPIRIGTCISDQSASMWGSCCFNKGDVKLTLGTGSFLNLNSGKICHASVHGLYPVVAWRMDEIDTSKEEILAYSIEGSSNDTGSIIRWAINFGLFTDPSKSSDIAKSVADSDGCYFIPAFSGLGFVDSIFWNEKHGCWKKAPINDIQAATGILGLRPSTKNEHIVRAVLESIAFRVAQLYYCTLRETNFVITTIRVDGGVSKNNFICQLLADLTGVYVERPENTEVSALGAGFLAGLNIGIWNSTDDLIKLRKIDKLFIPRNEFKAALEKKMESWERAVNRFKGWYNPEELQVISSSKSFYNSNRTTL